MDNKQKEQLKKGLVFSGLGLLCALSIWFIFAPSDKDKAEEQQGLNKDIPQATVEQLTDNKLKAYELGDKSASEEQAQAEMGRLSDYFADATPTPEVQQAHEASTAKIEGSLQRYEENNRLLSSFYAPDPHEEEREALRTEIDDLREELRKKDSEAEDEEEKQLRLMEHSYQMASKYLPKGIYPLMPLPKLPSDPSQSHRAKARWQQQASQCLKHSPNRSLSCQVLLSR